MDAMAGGGLFGPDMWGKLATNPETAPYLKDEAFVATLRDAQSDPSSMAKMANDPRMLKVFSVLLSSMVQQQQQHTPNGSAAAAREAAPSETAQVSQKANQASEHDRNVPRDEKKAKPDFEQYPADQRAQKEAEWEKEAGNSAYKARKFELAMQHYNRAIELHPENVGYLVNRAAVKLETKDYDGCIADCELAIKNNAEQNLRTDYKIIARAYGRIGTAYSKQGKHEQAIAFFEKSLLEARDDKIQDKLLEARRAKREADEHEYINPELSQAAREKGNDLFKKGDYPEAIKHYTEAIRRNPNEAAPYSNRAAAYMKLGEFPHAMKDCDKALELDPKFLRAYSRKASIHFFLKEYHKCMDIYQQGLALDPENREFRDGLRQTMIAIQQQQSSGEVDEAQLQHAMADPEIQSIMMDPMVQNLLKSLQQNPSEFTNVMKDPVMAKKINRLIAAGVLRTG
ncbi:Hsp70-Hsp90 organizing protein [Porphyridium purpureum]|uniref:Hsp70-Hsp90 organizing protein n=1 Tax=Porphyridium purpureum TaxID=35688 RepID=A0A5J4Z9T0_PORPP|nr:Hsp70-Hsp90 organizing protein [Porphyridium purpureum]|eukprot:POR1274..scf295_1